MNNRSYFALGIMTGTSLDGIDLSLCFTDGKTRLKNIKSSYVAYKTALRNEIKDCIVRFHNSKYSIEDLIFLRKKISKEYVRAIQKFIDKHNYKIDLICIHGQTVYHNPSMKSSIQLCDGPYIAKELKKKVVYDFRQSDLRNGGEGAPLAPIYHQLILKKNKLMGNTCFINIGGISNISICSSSRKLIAYDTGPGMCLLDKYVIQTKNILFDQNGKFSSKGKIDWNLINKLMQDNYFKKKYPKSLDNNYFKLSPFKHLDFFDTCATISAFTAASIVQSLKAHRIEKVIITGGGSKNKFIIKLIKDLSNVQIISNKDLDIKVDFVESDAFSYLGVRRLKNLPISFPSTTNVSSATTGGKII